MKRLTIPLFGTHWSELEPKLVGLTMVWLRSLIFSAHFLIKKLPFSKGDMLIDGFGNIGILFEKCSQKNTFST